MRSPRDFVALLVLLLAPAVLPAGATPAPPAGTVALTFQGSSTLHDFSGAAPAVAVVLRPSAIAGAWDADVRVPVATLSTANAVRDGGMRDMLHAERSPAIDGRFRDVDPERVRATRRLPFVLQVAGVARPLEAEVVAWDEAPDRLSFDATFDVSLAAFGLEAPGIAFMHVADIVHVQVHVTLAQGPA